MGFIPNPFFLLFLFPLSFLMLSSIFFSDATPNTIHHFQDEQVYAFHGKRLIMGWKMMKITAETPIVNSTNLILAAERTYRRDPTDNFRYYIGGWNPSNPHYLFSTCYASLGPFLIAVLWFVIFALWLFCMCICCCCGSRHTYGYSRTAYTLSLTFLVLFTLAVIVGSVLTCVGQARFETSVGNLISYILHRADTVAVSLMDLFNNILAAKNIGIGNIILPEKQMNDVEQIQNKINGVYHNFRDITTKNGNDIISWLNPVKLLLITIAAIMIVVALLGLLFSMIGVECLVYSLAMVGWIIVTITFIMSGIFLLVNNFVGDTCTAMNEWMQNPTADSILENIVPNVDHQITRQILSATKDVTYGVIEVANTYISNVSNANVTSNTSVLYYNQSGPLVPFLCNPYNKDGTDRQCAPNEVNFKNASHVWEKHVCHVSFTGSCVTPGRLTPTSYKQVITLVNVSSGLYDGIPFVIELMNGTFLTKTFSDLSKDFCSGLEEYSEWMYFGLITSSTMLMLLLVQWIIYSKQRKRRAYTKKIDATLHWKQVSC
ncbi:unnamed protein product [Cuscuta europaea]|uniref:Uncharacterized protein n=1 Tax=Cuscuta europaea TaxID=41803 RepID=A0A9P0ZMH2_CUSEU|nr:unnamed protein product [Cuscuta europaea]